MADGKARDLAAATWEDFGHRREHAPHLFDVLDEWARAYPVAALVEGAQLRRLPYAAVLPPDAQCDNPQLTARGFFGSATMDGRGEYPIDRFPALFNGKRPAVYEGVHQLGADTFEVATGLLGLDDGEVAD